MKTKKYHGDEFDLYGVFDSGHKIWSFKHPYLDHSTFIVTGKHNRRIHAFKVYGMFDSTIFRWVETYMTGHRELNEMFPYLRMKFGAFHINKNR